MASISTAVATCASPTAPWIRLGTNDICRKSSQALDYARAIENVTITNCYVTGTDKLGTLLDGSFERFDPATQV
ncbi:MAG: hypothetical protein ABSF15_03095 [Candidatus Sulfotelmatobacter sp.]